MRTHYDFTADMFTLKALVFYVLHITSVLTAVVSLRDDSSSHLSKRGVPLAKAIAASKEENAITYSPMFTDKDSEGLYDTPYIQLLVSQ